MRRLNLVIIGKIKSEGTIYKFFSGPAYRSGGLASMQFFVGLCNNNCAIGFFGCATEKIAQHFGKYFGIPLRSTLMIIESKYII